MFFKKSLRQVEKSDLGQFILVFLIRQASSNMFPDPTRLFANYGVRYKIVSSTPKRILETQAFEGKSMSSEKNCLSPFFLLFWVW